MDVEIRAADPSEAAALSALALRADREAAALSVLAVRADREAAALSAVAVRAELAAGDRRGKP
jgi:hypothetical protein